MDNWQELLTAALLGTEQRALQLSPFEGALGKLWAQYDNPQPEETLLGAAGGLALWRQAGYRPGRDERPLPSPCEPDDQPRCAPLAGQHLQLLLQGQYAEVLPEWLTLLAGAGRRVPEEHLPELLQAGRTTPEWRRLIIPVLGRRGRWLAALNPDWSYAAPGDDETVWQTGRRDERLWLLQRLRRAEPDRARQLLRSGWSQEPARDRAAFLECLAVGLDMADEPWLEEALDDRAKDVRRTAAELLARLPESRLVRRLSERAIPLLEWRPGRRRCHLQVTLPETLDTALQRDGIDLSVRDSGVGEKAGWLIRILGAVPPSLWCRQWRKTPAEIIAATRGNEWREALLQGWAMAARRHREIAWSEALLPLLPPHGQQEWLSALPPGRLQAYVMEWLREENNLSDRSLETLAVCPAPWSRELTLRVLDRIRRGIMTSRSVDWRLRRLLDYLVRCAAPEGAAEIAEAWPRQSPHWPAWESTVQEGMALLQFRCAMVKAIHA